MVKNSLKESGIIERYFHFEEKYKKLRLNSSILCELEMEPNDYENIIFMTKQYLNISPSYTKEVCNRIWLYAPITMLLTTITYAINHYDGSFWKNFGDTISLKQHSLWKENFYTALIKNDFYLFKGSKNQKFVYNILGHSGVPRSQVELYVKTLILPAIENDFSADEIQQIIKSKNNGTSLKTKNLRVALKDFIIIPDSIATNIIERSIEVWKEQLRPFPDHYVGYLPKHLLEEFEHVAQKLETSYSNNSIPLNNSNLNKAIRIKRPTLCYSPDYQNVYISLPKQIFSESVQEVTWLIENDGFQKSIKTLRLPYENNELEFNVIKRKSQFPILPKKTYNVKLMVDSEIKGDWYFELFDFTVFNAVSYEQILDQNIVGKELFIITTKYHEKLINSVNIEYHSIPLINDWIGFYELDITVLKAFSYTIDSKRLVFSPRRNSVTIVGKKHNLISDLPIYKGTISLRVSSKQFQIISKLSSWHVKLIHQFSGVNAKYHLKNDEFFKNEKGNFDFQFPNDFQSLLENNPGKYKLRLFGLLGSDIDISFYYLKESFVFLETNEDLTIEIPSNFEVNSLNSSLLSLDKNKKRIMEIPAYKKLDFEIKMPSSFEKITISYYPNNIALALIVNSELAALGTITNKQQISFDSSKLIIDLENPKIDKIQKYLTVALFEKLIDGTFNEKIMQLRLGRKHVLDLNYFQISTNSLSKRNIFIRIPSLSIDKRIITIETDWKINNWLLEKDKLSISISTTIPEVTFKIHDLLSGNQITELNFPENSDFLEWSVNCLENKMYIVSLSEPADDEFDFLFKESSLPDVLGPHSFLLPINVTNEFGVWLLENDIKTVDGEWEFDELKSLLDLVLTNKNLYLPLLLSQYESCVDFGLKNIELLTEILPSYEGENLQTLLLVAGVQEWDPQSVERAIINDFILPSDETLYSPIRLNDYLSYLEPQLNHSFNHTVYKEQCLTNFSLNHEIIKILIDMQTDSSYLENIEKFIENFESEISNLINYYREKTEIKFFKELLLSRKNENNFFYTIGNLAFYNSMLFYYEYSFKDSHVNLIREATKAAYLLAPKLFIHDIVYWKFHLNRFENLFKKDKERRKEFEHPSFTWKK